jgi:integrase/recombinase XerD
MNFLDVFDLYIEASRKAVVYGEKRASCTVKAYENKKLLIATYLKFCNLLSMQAEDFNTKMLKKYFEYLIRKNYKHNYAARCADICDTVMQFGVREGMVQFNRLAGFAIKKMKPGKPQYISPFELRRIEKLEPACSTIKKARAMFLAQCWTGMDYSDITTVRESHFTVYKSKEYIVKKRIKTGVEANIPLVSDCAELFAENNYTMSFLSNAKYNKALKELAKLCEINKLLTSHMGRKTFAMHKLNYEGYSMAAVSKMLGHASIKTTEAFYASIELELVHNEYTRLAG